jgi:hypothetical protein
VRSFAHRGVKAAGVALVLAAMLAAGSLAPSGGAASSDGSYGAQAAQAFKKCRAGQAKLKRNGILHLRARRAKCKLARQVAYGVIRGAKSPKGFACVTGEGGNQFPVRCTRGRQQVRFTLEG